jgi:hypothetical protein
MKFEGFKGPKENLDIEHNMKGTPGFKEEEDEEIKEEM